MTLAFINRTQVTNAYNKGNQVLIFDIHSEQLNVTYR